MKKIILLLIVNLWITNVSANMITDKMESKMSSKMSTMSMPTMPALASKSAPEQLATPVPPVTPQYPAPVDSKSDIYDPTKPLGGIKLPAIPVNTLTGSIPNSLPVGLPPVQLQLLPETVPVLGAIRFVNIPSLNIAIINGAIYKVKDTIKDSNFIVKKIKETSVIVINKQTKKSLEIKIIK